MTFGAFKIVYLSVTLFGVAGAVFLFRKRKDDFSILFLMSLVLAVFMAVFFLDIKSGNIDGDMMIGYVLRGLIHIQADNIFIFCDVCLWGTAAFAVGLKLHGKRKDDRLVWIFFIFLALFRSWFESFILGRQYPESMIRSSEWGIVLFDWLIIYLMAAFFITKGISAFEKAS